MKLNSLIILTVLFLSPIQNFAKEICLYPKKKILVGSPIRQDPEILKEFLLSLHRQNTDLISFDYAFVDDNVDPDSSVMLEQFKNEISGSCFILKEQNNDFYLTNEEGHHWHPGTVWKVAEFKNQIIKKAQELGYDYLFLVDSDIVMHPMTIEHLMLLNKDIVCEIFWTSWSPGTIKMPQVWISDSYNQYEMRPWEFLSDAEKDERQGVFLDKMKVPGVYEVGGLGACTLISRRALEKGVSFSRLKNVTFWGEDRHFCIRAIALDLQLFVDTHYPAYHIYRKSYLDGVAQFIQDCSTPNGYQNAWI